MDLGQLLEFKIAFPDEKPLTVEGYMKGGSRKIILDACSFFLGFKQSNSRFHDNAELLRSFFSQKNADFANRIYKVIKNTEDSGRKIGIVNSYSSLRLFETFYGKEETEQTLSNEEFERNLFKAYLVLNSEFTALQLIASSSTKDIDGEFKVVMQLFCMQYPIFDKVNYDINQIPITQTLKAIYLFEFLNDNVRTKTLILEFLKFFNKQSWQDYLKSFLGLVIPSFKNEKEGCVNIQVNKDSNFLEGCRFIEKQIIEKTDDFIEDFITIRTKPFYKIDDGIYRVIFNLFVAEKIFKGVYFILRELNKTLQKPLELKSIIGKGFSEEVLVAKIMRAIYPKNTCIHFSGKELEERGIDNAPDYYLRDDKNILLIESKDFLIKTDVKLSFDFKLYESEFKRVLYYEDLENGKRKFKAIKQLITSIEKILKSEFTPDSKYHYNKVFIYPILVTHDLQYDTPGFNELLNHWFEKEIKKLKDEGLFVNRVQPLTVVNIDSLIMHQVGLSSNIPLHVALKYFIEHAKRKPKKPFLSEKEMREFFLSKYQSFTFFIENYFKGLKIFKVPPFEDLVISKLLNK